MRCCITLGFAAVNALTRELFDRARFVPPTATDSIGGIDPQPGEQICDPACGSASLLMKFNWCNARKRSKRAKRRGDLEVFIYRRPT